MREQEILVFDRAAVPEGWLPEEGGVPLPWPELEAWLAGAVSAGRWMSRERAEADPRWKQPIPYLVLRDGSGAVAAYRRSGSEGRLHGLWSVGVGGHVERRDEAGSLAGTLLACARRELAEELHFAAGAAEPGPFLGLVNEEVTEVGRVHWGLVFEVRCGERPRPGAELRDLRWLPPAEALALPLERWSRLALALLWAGDGRPAAGPAAGEDQDTIGDGGSGVEGRPATVAGVDARER